MSYGPHAARVTQTEFGEAWPFTVESGVLRCEGGVRAGDEAVTIEVGTIVYAVNDVARSRSFANLRPIWENDSHTGAMKDLSLIVERGIALCRAP